jgi:DNA-binding protein WhiA
MSFSLTIKRELCKLPQKDRCCVLAELSGVVCFGAQIKDNTLSLRVENAAVAKRVFMLVRDGFGISPEILSSSAKRGTSYKVVIADSSLLHTVLEELGMLKNSHDMKNFVSFSVSENVVRDECCRRSFLRGAFLVSGSCSSPDKGYHLELATNRIRLIMDTVKILEELDITAKSITRKTNTVIYLKGSELISDFLGNIGAVNAMLEFENARIIKDVKNNINRVINCETANMTKAIDASMSQVKAIEKIKKLRGLESLEPSLREIATLRLENTEVTLKELGQMLEKPLSKSGVNHRLKKLEEIAESLS